MKNLYLTLAATITLLGSTAMAHHYGMAGCGIGALAFKDQPGKIQILAATLNDIISPQTSAITSGTSNCVEHATADVALYIEMNKKNLRNDIARGEGEALSGLLQVMSCDTDRAAMSTLKDNYETIFSNESASAFEVENSIRLQISGKCRS